MTPRGINSPNSSQQIDIAPTQQNIDVGGQFPFQSHGQLPTIPRSNVNLQYSEAGNKSDDQEPCTSTGPRRIAASTPDPMLSPSPRASIRVMVPALNIRRHQQSPSQAAHILDTQRRDYTSKYGEGR